MTTEDFEPTDRDVVGVVHELHANQGDLPLNSDTLNVFFAAQDMQSERI